MTSDWPGLLDARDPAAARAVWQQKFSSDSDSPAATWELAEIEERWGDALFFSGQDGAALHYHAAWRALMPLGMVFSSWQEGERRTDAYERITVKLRAIDPYGIARIGNTAQAHPNFHAIEPPAKPEPVAAPEPAPQPAKLESEPVPVPEPESEPEPAKPEPEPVPDSLQSTPLEPSQPADPAPILQANDHWRHYGLGLLWRDAGQEFAAMFPDAARRAFRLSVDYFELYNQAWTAHAPASRWDSDGVVDIVVVQSMMKALDDVLAGAPTPSWIEALLAGDWRRALAALGDTVPPPAFKAAGELLSEARRTAGEGSDVPEISRSQV